MKLLKLSLFAIVLFMNRQAIGQSMVSFSFDDPNTENSPLFSWKESNEKILSVLDKYKLTSTLFVCGHRVDNKKGDSLLRSWDNRNHQLANHTYSHRNFNASEISFPFEKNDFLKNDTFISKYSNFTRLFRYPYLKEGETKEKRDSMRSLQQSLNYKNGYVSIDASDWYINTTMIRALEKDIKTDLTPYKKFYIQHILERAAFYDSLAFSLTHRKIKHVLLLHDNLLNALFLDDLILAFTREGWKLVDTKEAYKDPIYQTAPDIIPAGEGIVWGLAKESGKYNAVLRYPAEDSKYEERRLKQFLKAYKRPLQ